MNLNLEVELHNKFKSVAAAQGRKMTDILVAFIRDYIDKHSPEKPSKKGRR